MPQLELAVAMLLQPRRRAQDLLAHRRVVLRPRHHLPHRSGPLLGRGLPVTGRGTARIICALALAASPLVAQAPLPRADSALVGRTLLAEDGRDSTAAALVEGAHHAEPRVQLLARRALARIRDSLFTARDSIPSPPRPADLARAGMEAALSRPHSPGRLRRRASRRHR